MFKKLFPVVVLAGLIIVGVRFFSGPHDTWTQSHEGVWIRKGNPSLPIPQKIVEDCYHQNNTRAFDVAYIICREDLCGADRACAQFLQTAFQDIISSDKTEVISDARMATPRHSTTQKTANQNRETNAEPQTSASSAPSTPPGPKAIEEQGVPSLVSNRAESDSSQPAEQTPPTSDEPSKISPTITIETPARESSVTSPIVITGKVKAAAGEPITIRVTTKSGTALINETVNLKTSGPDGWGSYKITIAYQFSSTREGYVVVSHGNETASVPVKFE